MPVIDPRLPYAEHLKRRANALSTLATHAGESNPGKAGPLEPPLVLSSAFGFSIADEAADAFQHKNDAYIYGRWGNPSVEALEGKLAAPLSTREDDPVVLARRIQDLLNGTVAPAS